MRARFDFPDDFELLAEPAVRSHAPADSPGATRCHVVPASATYGRLMPLEDGESAVNRTMKAPQKTRQKPPAPRSGVRCQTVSICTGSCNISGTCQHVLHTGASTPLERARRLQRDAADDEYGRKDAQRSRPPPSTCARRGRAISATPRGPAMLDLIAQRRYGTISAVYHIQAANPDLAALGPRLPAGTQVRLPDIDAPPEEESRLVQLWD